MSSLKPFVFAAQIGSEFSPSLSLCLSSQGPLDTGVYFYAVTVTLQCFYCFNMSVPRWRRHTLGLPGQPQSGTIIRSVRESANECQACGER
jgi:hypothetical protein